jgi:hypothetical protein
LAIHLPDLHDKTLASAEQRRDRFAKSRHGSRNLAARLHQSSAIARRRRAHVNNQIASMKERFYLR